MTDTTNGGSERRDIAGIEADIAETREQLAATVDELTARLDVKARARARLRELRARATDDHGRPTPPVVGAAVAVLAVGILVAALTIRGRRR